MAVMTSAVGDPSDSAAPKKMKTFPAEIEWVSGEAIRTGGNQRLLRFQGDHLHPVFVEAERRPYP